MKEKKFDQIKYNNDYNKNHYDRINMIFPPGTKEILKARAAAQGISISAYVRQLIENDPHAPVKDYAINTDGLEKK